MGEFVPLALDLIPCRRATAETFTPGCKASPIIACFLTGGLHRMFTSTICGVPTGRWRAALAIMILRLAYASITKQRGARSQHLQPLSIFAGKEEACRGCGPVFSGADAGLNLRSGTPVRAV
jgi:hypothetical protein